MVQSRVVPPVAVRGKKVDFDQIVADRLNDAPGAVIDLSSVDQFRDMAGRLSAVCGTVITVGWSILQFQITAVREDGVPLTECMQEAFQNLLCDEFDCSLPLGL